MALDSYLLLRKVTSESDLYPCSHMQHLLHSVPGCPCSWCWFALLYCLGTRLPSALFPSLSSHLDNHSLWEPKIFATRCFRIIMYSIQVGSWWDFWPLEASGDTCACLGAPKSVFVAGLSHSSYCSAAS